MVKKTRKKTRIKNADERYMGPEPTKADTRMNFWEALNWYNYYYDLKSAKPWLMEYCLKHKIPFNDLIEVNTTMCAIAHMINKGMVLPEEAYTYLDDKLQNRRIRVKDDRQTAQILPFKKFSEKAGTVISIIDDFLDVFWSGNYVVFDTGTYDLLKEHELIPKDAKIVQQYYQEILDDLKNHPEDYTSRGKKKYNNHVKFMTHILEDIEQYLSNKKVVKTRKPRKKRAVDTSKLVSKVNYQKEAPDLKLVSAPPEKIVGAHEVWLYNTKYRKLIYLVAEGDSAAKLTIKGTTVQNIDKEKSMEKMIRKPADVLGEFTQATKARKRKQFEQLTTKAQATTGRINGYTIILGVY